MNVAFYSNICHYFCFVFFYFDKLLSSSLLPTSNILLCGDKMNWSLTYFSSSLVDTMRLILLVSYMFLQMWTVLWYRSTSFDWKLQWLDSKNVWSVCYVFSIVYIWMQKFVMELKVWLPYQIIKSQKITIFHSIDKTINHQRYNTRHYLGNCLSVE